GAASGPPAPGALPPFASVIKDARKTDGLFTVWQKDDKVWIELAESDFNTPLFLAPKLVNGLGEGRLLGGLMLGSGSWVEFRRIHNQVQLIERNAEFTARAGTPEARAVAASYSPSLISSAMVASAPQPERKTVLVDASALFMGDLLGLASQLQRSYRQGYSFDARNSAITAVRNKPDLLVFEVLQHHATASISQPMPGAPQGTPAPSVPLTLPDARSLFLKLHYSLTRLPAQPMAVRAADARIGHFTSIVSDFSDDLQRSPKLRHVNRWRLEKKDPAAALSEPVKPITFWLDRTIPLKYRDTVRDGVLAWNAAFERIGFKDAIVVKVQPDDAEFDTLDTGIASVRWMLNQPNGLAAIGPTQVDPRSGEILDADIAIEGGSLRFQRLLRTQILDGHSHTDWAALMQSPDAGTLDDPARNLSTAAPGVPAGAGLSGGSTGTEHCELGEQGALQLAYALDVLAASDALGVDGERTEAFIRAHLKNLVMHEVGHTLGLRHNFRASSVYSERQLADPVYTRNHPLAGSVMDYTAINLAAPGEPMPAPFQTVLGPYDYWAIEYAYKPIAPAAEAVELARIAARSGEPELAYGTDEDNLIGLDPETLQFDLGSDPVAHARKRIEIARDLIRRLEARARLAPVAPADAAGFAAADDAYPRLRRSVAYALRDVAAATGVLMRQIGGVRTLRDAPATGRDPLQPVDAARQRRALDLIASAVLSPQGLSISPALQRRLAPDYLDRADALGQGAAIGTDFVPDQLVSGTQRAVLGQLMSDTLAQRLIDSAGKVQRPDDSLPLAELYQRIGDEVWSELGARGAAHPRRGLEITPLRRELQREHATRIASLLLRPSGAGPAEARSLLRSQARDLIERIHAATGTGTGNASGSTTGRTVVAAGNAAGLAGPNAATRAHLLDMAEVLREALSAKLVRTAS
ncbi:MAG: zinc-dependent metalloprotease, partial [Leptothrix sp. (in: b-proteobacteria)]